MGSCSCLDFSTIYVLLVSKSSRVPKGVSLDAVLFFPYPFTLGC